MEPAYLQKYCEDFLILSHHGQSQTDGQVHEQEAGLQLFDEILLKLFKNSKINHCITFAIKF